MNMNKVLEILFSILAIVFGILVFVYGEYDDSPGGQLFGVIMAVGGIVGIVKSRKKNGQ